MKDVRMKQLTLRFIGPKRRLSSLNGNSMLCSRGECRVNYSLVRTPIDAAHYRRCDCFGVARQSTIGPTTIFTVTSTAAHTALHETLFRISTRLEALHPHHPPSRRTITRSVC